MGRASDRELGMLRRIHRRDFLNGVAIGAASLLARPALPALALEAGDPEKRAGYYPPALTGIRGSHEGVFEVAHALRDDTFWEDAGEPQDTGERYDLVVVGGGISGLSAAHFFRTAAGQKARVLVLENHDDIGGHCRRNEFTYAGRTILTYGGAHAVDSPGRYGPIADGLLRELGVEMSRSAQVHDARFYASLGLGRGVFLDKETFGADKLVPDPLGDFGGEANDEAPPGRDPWPEFLKSAPMEEAARRELHRICASPVSVFGEVTAAELAKTSYAELLKTRLKAHSQILAFLQCRTHSLYGVGIDAVAAADAKNLGLPGFGPPGKGLHGGDYFFHFPDGNASLVRLLVRRLVPAALPGKSMDDSVLARLDYGRLDEDGRPVRIRLNSTAVRAREKDGEVEVAYMRLGKLRSVRASACVLACWNGVIPYLCPEMPEKQQDALRYGAKVPLVYTNVLVRDWQAFHKLGVCSIHAPGGYHTTVDLGRPTRLGGYASPSDPKEPMALHLVRTPCYPGIPARQQHRAGRVELLSTPFATFERNVREQLGRILGPGGFDPARDVLALTVNRWPHGYTYEYSTLWDPFLLDGGERPCDVARKPFGRIAIANADAGARAYADGAIDEAHRAVQEVLAVGGRPAERAGSGAVGPSSKIGRAPGESGLRGPGIGAAGGKPSR